MIARAKSGDPEANYELSLWALERSEEEPEEGRWNRLAAKCLVKAAQAGYGPAQERMAELLAQAEPPKTTRRQAPARQAEPPEPVRLNEARQAAPKTASRQAPARQTTARRPAPQRTAIREDDWDDDYDQEEEEDDGWDDDYEDDRPARRNPFQGLGKGKSSHSGGGRKGGGMLPFSQWGDTQWRKMEMICIFICAALILTIAILFITGRGGESAPAGNSGGSALPAAGQVNAENDQSGAAQASYPDAATLAAIQAAALEIPPDDADFIAPVTATVSVGEGALRLRPGPNTSYTEITQMPDGSKVKIVAKKNEWDLVQYNGDTWGWCSGEYLIEDAPGTVG